MPMSSKTVDISDQDVENRPPSEPLSCTNNTNGPSISNPPPIKRNSYMKQGGRRRRRWWYFNRGLQPISELAEIKDDAVKCDNHNDSPTNLDDSHVINNYLPTNNTNTIISNESTQNKESYSACLKLIEKFQEVVMDSAVRVIQAAFKRFRERRRFLRIKKAVMVIQRNLRKWLETKHPCIRPADFERQSSDGSKSEEYRESVGKESEDFVAEEKMENEEVNNGEPEECHENNDTNENESSIENNTLHNPQENELDLKNVDAGLECDDKTIDVEPTCVSKSEEETVESSAAENEKPVMVSTESKQEILQNEDLFLGEVTPNDPDATEHENKTNQSEESKDLITAINIEVDQDDLHREDETHSKTTTDDSLKERKEKVQNVLNDKEEQVVNATLPESLKVLCQKSLHSSNSHNIEDVES